MTSTDPTAAPAATASETEPLRALLRQKQFAEVLAAGSALLARDPGSRDALLFVAIAQRNLGQVAEALETLTTLERYHPRFSRLYEERGHCYVVLRDAPNAIQAFLAAVNINPALPASCTLGDVIAAMTGHVIGRARLDGTYEIR